MISKRPRRSSRIGEKEGRGETERSKIPNVDRIILEAQRSFGRDRRIQVVLRSTSESFHSLKLIC